jgi:hypothetical protein
LKCILENNVVEFNGKLYKQKIGTAMGSVPSPEVCDILMFDILEEINNRFQFKHKILIRFSFGLNFDPIIKGISFLFLIVGYKKVDLSSLSTIDMLFSISDSR